MRILWGVVAVVGVALASLVGWMLFQAAIDSPGFGPTAAGGPAPESGEAAAAQERVLQGVDVAFWAEGSPFVRVPSEFDDEGPVPPMPIMNWLISESANPVNEPGYSDIGYTYNRGNPDPYLRLGLVHQHGLFGQPVNRGEAVRNYRMADAAGSVEARQRLAELGEN